MPEFTIKHDILAPQHELIREFSGQHLSRLMSFVPNEMKFVWRLESSQFFEDKLKWNVSSDPLFFYGEWRGKDNKDILTDSYSVGWVKIRLQGYQSSKTKAATATMWITGWIQTEIDYENPLFDTLKYVYIKTLYQKQIHYFIRHEKQLIDRFDKAVREFLEVPASPKNQ